MRDNMIQCYDPDDASGELECVLAVGQDRSVDGAVVALQLLNSAPALYKISDERLASGA